MADFAKATRLLKRTLGKRKVFTQPEETLAYSFDASRARGIPVAVVYPDSPQDVIKVTIIAAEHHLPIAPRGAGTGMTGGSVPLKPAIALSFERMNRIIDIDPVNRVAVVEPGVITAKFQEEVSKYHLYYPPDPASFRMSTLGGNVAENSGGLRCLKYGVTADYLIGTEFVTASGELIPTGYFDNFQSEFDLTQLLCGSEGTLGIIVKIALRLIEPPPGFLTILVEFSTAVEAALSVTQILSSGFTPSVIEFIDRTALEAVTRFGKFELAPGAAAVLLIEFDDEADLNRDHAQTTEKICRENGALNIKFAESEEEREDLWTLRRSISSSLSKLNTCRINEDISVPRGKIAEVIDFVVNLSEEIDMPIPAFGHGGDGNIHMNFIFDKNSPDELKRAEMGVDRLFTKVMEMGGTISGEHGIGVIKSKYLPRQLGGKSIRLHRQIKKFFDPDNLLNPGKILS